MSISDTVHLKSNMEFEPPCFGPQCPPIGPPCVGPNCPPFQPFPSRPPCFTPPCYPNGPFLPPTQPCSGPFCPPVHSPTYPPSNTGSKFVEEGKITEIVIKTRKFEIKHSILSYKLSLMLCTDQEKKHCCTDSLEANDGFLFNPNTEDHITGENLKECNNFQVARVYLNSFKS